MSADLRTRVLAAVAAEASPTRSAVNRRNSWVAVLGAVAGVVAFVLFAALVSHGELLRLGGETAHHHLERSPWLVLATAGGALGVALAALWLALGRGGSMLGRPWSWLLAGIILIPFGLLAWKIGCSLAFGDAMMRWPERPGLRCLALSTLVGLVPLSALLALRRQAFVNAELNGAAMGVAAGACAWVAVDLWCPVAYVPHLLLGHLLPLLLLAGIGALVARHRAPLLG